MTQNTQAAIQYLPTAYIDSSGKFSEKKTDYTIHDVIRVTKGTLVDSLCLTCYCLRDIFTLLNLDRELCKTDRVMERLKSFPKIIVGSILTIHEDNLYGVVIKDSVPEIVGVVGCLFTSLNKQLDVNCLLLDGKDSECKGQLTVRDSRKVHYDPRTSVLITIPLGGHCFVQYGQPNQASGDTNDQPPLEQLALLVGTSFLLLNNVSLTWVKFKNKNIQESESFTVDPGKVMFMHNGGCVRKDTGFTIHGLGPRKSNYNEAYYYAMMHWGESFNQAPADVF